MATVGVKRADVGEIPYCFVVTENCTDVTVPELMEILPGRLKGRLKNYIAVK